MDIIINYHGVNFKIDFDYQPYEPMVMYERNGDPGSEGCAESIHITGISCAGVDFYEFLTEYVTEDQKRKILADLELRVLESRSDAFDPDCLADTREDR